MNTHYNPVEIARHFLKAQPTPPWHPHDPVTIYEVHIDPNDHEAAEVNLLAAGHDPLAVFQQAAQAPDRGAPAALIFQAPGELVTTDAVLDDLDNQPPGAVAAAGEHPDAKPHPGTRALVATPAGLAGGMVIRRANGEPTDPICGTETPDAENPQHRHLVALLAARRTPHDVKQATVEKITEALAERLQDIDPDDLDAENLPEDVAEIMRAAAAEALHSIGMSALLDAVDPDARTRRPDALPEDYDAQAAALLATLENDPAEIDAPPPTPDEINAQRAALIDEITRTTADVRALTTDLQAAAARLTPGLPAEDRADLLAHIETLRARHREHCTRAEHIRRAAVALGIDPTGRTPNT